jgi:hypothetical protein
MQAKHQRFFIGGFLILVPPIAALAMAALAVGVSRHHEAGAQPAPAIWDALFPIFFLASFFTVPAGIYVIYRALKS